MDLGVMVNIFEETEFTGAFEDACAAGFTHGQVNIYLPDVTPEEVRQLALAARNEGFHADAIGCYMNPLRPSDNSIGHVTLADWQCIVENMAMMNGVERIVCWSGTVGKTLATPNLLNHQEDTFAQLVARLQDMLDHVQGLPIELLIEPFTAHVIHDAATCNRLAQHFPAGEVKIVLDAPNIVAHKDFLHRNAVVKSHIQSTASAVGMIHLKDLARDQNDHRKYPRSGAGALNYGSYLSCIQEHVPEVPVVIDAPILAEAVAARSFIQCLLAQIN